MQKQDQQRGAYAQKNTNGEGQRTQNRGQNNQASSGYNGGQSQRNLNSARGSRTNQQQSGRNEIGNQNQSTPKLDQFAEEEQKVGSNNYEMKQFKNNFKLLAVSDEGPQIYTFQIDKSAGQTGTNIEEQESEILTLETGYPKFPSAELSKFSPINGHQLAVVDQKGIHVVDIQNKLEVAFFERKQVVSLEWSPKGTYLVTCEKARSNGNQNNLNVWLVNPNNTLQQRGLAASFEWGNNAKEGALSLKFDHEEQFCARQNGRNLIEIYENTNLKELKFQIKSKLPPLPKVNGVVQEDTRPDNSRFDGFIFCPIPNENRGLPNAPCYLMGWQNGEVLSENEDNGLVYVYDLNSNLQRPKFNIACPKAHNITVIPAPSGHAILAWAQNLTDSTGKSYYGEHSLQYVRIHKGKNRVFIPVFDNQIQDVQWTPDGSSFIVISGQQPATATLYDGDGQPRFEFGKHFRNTLRVCPFSSSLLIGGFGNITKGEMDLWSLETHKEIGKTKFPCATRIQWSPCGRYYLCSVLYERLKVDNCFQIFRGNGSKVLLENQKFKELHSAEWQPYPSNNLPKPDLQFLLKEDRCNSNLSEVQKPKKLFKYGKGGESSAFQQMMRQQMASGTSDKGPKKVDANQYKELQDQQTLKAQQIIMSQANTFSTGQTPSSTNSHQKVQDNKNQKQTDSGPNWRLGKFHDDNDENQYLSEQIQIEEKLQQESKVKISEGKPSKHAQRRQKKKEEKRGPIITDEDPSLDDLL